jgi:hypothetical protein
MKKFLSCVAVIMAIIVVAGCVSSPSAASSTESTDLPDWYLNPPEDDGMIYGIGSARMGNESRTQKAAEHRARTSVAFQLEVLVDTMEEDYTSEAGTDDDPAALNYFAAIDRQLASQALSEAKIIQRWKRSDGTLFVLTEFSKETVRNTAKSVAENSASRLAEAKAKVMLDEMDKQLEKKLKPIPVESD